MNKKSIILLTVLIDVLGIGIIIPVLAGAWFSLRTNLPFWASAIFSFLAFIIIMCEKKRNKLAGATINAEALTIAEQQIEFTG